MSDQAAFEASVTQSGMTASVDLQPRELRSVQLAGFSLRDREIMRLFLRRPPGTGIRMDLVDAEADLLIGNATTPEVLELLRARGTSAPSVGIVERFERDAPFYQVAQDSQLLFSLAQAINRIRGGWMPPLHVSPTDDSTAKIDATVTEDIEIRPPAKISATLVTTAKAAVIAASAPPAPPPVAASDAAKIAATAGLPWQRALHILVVDDSHFSREAISAALVKVGFSVDTAASGPAGLKMAAERHFDVALIDFEMPEMLGPEVLRKLRALGTQAPSVLIMLTSRTGAVDRLRAKFAGCDAYLTKPTQMKEFLSTLRNLAVAGKLSRQ